MKIGTTTMGGKAFVDTNVLLRSTVHQFPHHQQIKQFVTDQRDADMELWISRQVIREYLVQVTRVQSFMRPMNPKQVEAQILTMRALFKIADDTEIVTMQLMELLKAYPTGGKQVHDANLVATMLVNEIDTLLTLNVDDLKRFSDRITLLTPTLENP